MKYIFNEITHYRFPTHVNDLVMDRADAETSEVFITVLDPPVNRRRSTSITIWSKFFM